MADTKTATYAIRFDSNAKQVGSEGSQSLDQLGASVGRAKENIRTLAAAMGGLKGSSDAVKSARESLKAQLDAERSAVTAGSLALLKQGTSYEQLAAKEKLATSEAAKFRKEQELAAKQQEAKAKEKEAEELTKLAASLRAAGGPTQDLRERFKTLGEAFSTSAGRMALFVAGTAALVTAIADVASTIAGAAVSLGRWILESSNAARTANVVREAWTGSAISAQHLGNQLDALARKVATPKAELQELAGSIVRATNGTRLSGQGMVDTFNAVAQASAAMGQQAGAAIEDIIKRSARFGRVSINPFELQGTGIKQQDVAGELAKRLKIGVGQAQLALMQGRVKVDDAAAALRAAVEKRFGKINASKMLDLGTIVDKAKEAIAGLTKDVHLEPLLVAFKSLASLFDTTTVGGKNLKILVTFIGNNLVSAFAKAAPIARTFFLHLELGALQIAIAIARARNQIQAALGGMGKDFDLAGAASTYFGHTVNGVVKPIVSTIEIMARVIRIAITGWKNLAGAVDSAKARFTGFVELGKNVVDGIIEGIETGIAKVKDTVGNLADEVKNAFKLALGIASPSVVFEGYGKQTAAGYRKGLEGGTPEAQGAADRMAPGPPPAAPAPAGQGAAKGRGAPAPIHVTVQINVQGGGDVATSLAAPNFVRDLTRALEEAMTAAGLPMQTQAAP